jgi:hypothetical protein
MKDKLQIFKSTLRSFRTNLKGVEIKPKLLVIESDDWGAIRTPSKESVLAFRNKGLDLANSIYKVDSLASKDDLSNLFELLLSFKGSDGNPPLITANSIMANPDFDKIKKSNYLNYYYEPFYETFKKYPNHSDNLTIWKKGIKEKVFMPQFHGREHLNINRWLNVLKEGNEFARLCFDWRATYSGQGDYSFMEALDWNNEEDIKQQEVIIKEGLDIFENTFKFKSSSFIAPCYTWDSRIEKVLSEKGINIIQGIRKQLTPTGTYGNYNYVPHFFGERNKYGSLFSIRNGFFEPTNDKDFDWVNNCLAQIQVAFLLKKPAIISTHRINYIGFIDESNRDFGLFSLKKLLKKVIKKWPEVRFISTNQLNQFIHD